MFLIYFLQFLVEYFLAIIYNLFFAIEKEGEVYKVTYYVGQSRRHFFLPPCTDPGTNVYLVKNGVTTNVTQRGGIPMLVSASNLGGEELILETLDGEMIHYTKNAIPYLS